MEARSSLAGRVPAPWQPAVLRRWLYPYFLYAAATFLAGAVAGAGAMAATSPAALVAAADAVGGPALFPERVTTWTVFSNNVMALAVLAAGVVTFGLTAFVGLFFNGLLLGTVVYLGAAEPGVVATLALILPHGGLELGAFFVVGAIAYRVAWRLVVYLRGAGDEPLTREELGEAVVLGLAAVVAIAVAAWIEANLTVEIARLVTGEPFPPG